MVGVCEIHLHLPEVTSLKGKRKVIKGLKDRIKHRYNVSISELNAHDKWQRAVLGVAYINRDQTTIDHILHSVVGVIESTPAVWLTDYFIEFF